MSRSTFQFLDHGSFCRYISRALGHTVGTNRLNGRRQSPDIVCHELGNNYSSTPSRESFFNDPFLKGQRMFRDVKGRVCERLHTFPPSTSTCDTLFSFDIFLLDDVIRDFRALSSDALGPVCHGFDGTRPPTFNLSLLCCKTNKKKYEECASGSRGHRRRHSLTPVVSNLDKETTSTDRNFISSSSCGKRGSDNVIRILVV